MHENLHSLALTIEAMRAIERHGGALMMERAFEGFASLPAPGSASWWSVLQVRPTASAPEIEAAFRRLARERHPDAGGSDAMMAELNAARAHALKERS
jgi:DnaJ-domain-containing protein 1